MDSGQSLPDDEDLADSIQRISLNASPATTYSQLIRGNRKLVETYGELVKAFNRRARACVQARDDGIRAPKEKQRPFKSFEQRKKEQARIVQAWKDYFGSGTFGTGKALNGLWVNICVFLDFRESHKEVAFFATEEELSVYARATGKIYPRSKMEGGNPLELLLAGIYDTERRNRMAAQEDPAVPRVEECRTWTLDDEHWIVKSHPGARNWTVPRHIGRRSDVGVT